MAIVYKAYDTHLEREVAIKIIRTEKLTQESMGKSLKRFEREAKSLAKLSHTNIIPIIDSGEQNETPYLVMGYIPGGTLKERMKGKSISWQEAAKFLAPIARALDYAHNEGIVHRDIKPSNILITKENQPMLTDFGIARILESDETMDLTGTGMGVGTPDYMAPEQGLGHKVDHRADIYALGIIFYEMVTGRKPFQADTPMAVVVKHIHDPLPRPTEFAPDLPDAIEHVLLKALAKNPEDRYQDMGTFAVALENPGAEKRHGKRIFSSPGFTRQKRSSKIWFWLVGLFIIAAMAWAGIRLRSQGVNLRPSEATMDPAQAIQMVRNMTWTAQINSQATATQNRYNYLATQTVVALTPSATPKTPTITPTGTSTPVLNIIIDGKPDDWGDIQPFLIDKSGDTLNGRDNEDLVAAFMYLDESNLYLMVKTLEKLTKRSATFEINYDFGLNSACNDGSDLHTNINNDPISHYLWQFSDECGSLNNSISPSRTRTFWGEVLEVMIPLDIIPDIKREEIKIVYLHFWTTIDGINTWQVADNFGR